MLNFTNGFDFHILDLIMKLFIKIPIPTCYIYAKKLPPKRKESLAFGAWLQA